jgi:recombination protein RecT
MAQINQLAEVREQLTRPGQLTQFEAALPAHIPVQRFIRVVQTAISQTPELLECDRRSLMNACMRAAQDGLLPDGRLGALVVYKDRKRNMKTVSWLPMIAGIRQKVRNSGEVATWDAEVVYERDVWEYERGDHPRIVHKPTPGDRGKVIAAYSIAVLRSGEISREWMWLEDLEKVRAVSRAERGPWADWTEEMYKKTVAKRHSKVLPMSTDLDDLLRRPDEPDGDHPPVGSAGGASPAAAAIGSAAPSATLSDALDQIAGRTLAPHNPTTSPDDEFDAGGEVIDAGEYSDNDDEQLPLDDKPRAAAGTST